MMEEQIRLEENKEDFIKDLYALLKKHHIWDFYLVSRPKWIPETDDPFEEDGHTIAEIELKAYIHD